VQKLENGTVVLNGNNLKIKQACQVKLLGNAAKTNISVF